MQSSRRHTPRFWSSGLQVGFLLGVCACVSTCRNPYEPPGIPPVIPEDRDPAWSPDGQWLAFEHVGSDSTPGLYVARVDGTERRLLVPGGHTPDWSPDGTMLVMGIGYSYQIFRFDLATDSVAPLTTDGFNVVAAWSPDGQAIAFSSDGGTGGPTQLWLMDTQGSAVRRVPVGTPEQPGPAADDWAPSGGELVGRRFWPTSPTSFTWRLFRTDTTGRDTAWLTPPNVDAQQAAWSPTGEWIAYLHAPGRSSEIRLIRPDGTGDHLLTRNGFHPTWSPDGHRVAFSRRSLDEVAVWSVDLTGANPQQLSWPRGRQPTPAISARPSRSETGGTP